jgi:16S rRNA (uracil1498-N3)-methyltransferase
MQLFYLENPEDEITLGVEESKHASKVLRKKEGDILNFTDGKGGLYKAKITDADTRKCKLKIITSEQKEKQHNYYLHIAIAPTKNIERFEWFLEKSTEIGIDEITPIICNRSERKIVKIERGRRILLSAMKQSLKFHLPKLNKAIDLNDFIKKDFNSTKYIAHCEDGIKKELKKIKNTKRHLILIGPEGDFNQKEIDLSIQNKFIAVNLASTRLRTETAGIIAAHLMSLMK